MYTKDIGIAIRSKDFENVLNVMQCLTAHANFYTAKNDNEVIIIEFTWIKWDETLHPEISNLMEYLEEIDAVFIARGEDLNDNEELFFNDAEDLMEHLELIRTIKFEGNLIKRRGIN